MSGDPVDELSHFNEDELISETETRVFTDEELARIAAIVDRFAWQMAAIRAGGYPQMVELVMT